MEQTQLSPLTAHDVPTREDVRRDIFYFDDICGRWSITTEADFGDASILGGRLETDDGRLSEADTRRVIALARSEVWRLNNLQQRMPLFMTLRGATTARRREGSADDREVILTVEELVEVARRLSLGEKALKTLENLIAAEGEIGAGVGIPYLLREYPGQPDWPKGKPPNEIGISYGCTEIEAPMVYQSLIESGFVIVRPPQTHQSPSRAFITPKGYAKVQELRTGATPTVLQAFFVCRFIPQLDELFDRVFQPIGADLGCTIRRIKDIHHIDKIDDRICEEIRRSRIVLVDLTAQNFNVAFEAGYALALNKPIVWTKRKEAGDAVMPFDIYTYNCLEWEVDKIDEFKEGLRFRILAALQKADRMKA
jgi:hypothetical protein